MSSGAKPSPVLRRAAMLLTACSAARTGAVRTTSGPATPADGMAVLQQMHDRYDGTWYTTLRFVQKTTRHLPDGKSAVTTWYETLQHTPERGTLLRIDVGAPSEGNGMLYSVDSVVRLRGGKVVARTGDGNPFLPLIEGVYVQPVSTTAQQIRALGIDLGKVYPREWNGAPVWVVGATSAADTTSAQMWVEPARMIVTRAIVPSGAGQPPLDIRLEGYEPAGRGGWRRAS